MSKVKCISNVTRNSFLYKPAKKFHDYDTSVGRDKKVSFCKKSISFFMWKLTERKGFQRKKVSSLVYMPQPPTGFKKLQICSSRGPPLLMQFLAFSTIYFWQYYLVLRFLIDSGRLNLPINAKFHKKS